MIDCGRWRNAGTHGICAATFLFALALAPLPQVAHAEKGDFEGIAIPAITAGDDRLEGTTALADPDGPRATPAPIRASLTTSEETPAPAFSPLPRPRPAAFAARSVMPRPRPASLGPITTPASAPAIDDEPGAEDQAMPGIGTGRWPAATVARAKEACAAALAGRDVTYAPQPAVGQPGSCGIAYPVEVSAVSGVKIEPPALMNCQMAAALDKWISGAVQPAAQARMSARLIAIKNAASYVCRRRNNITTAKISEHAFGNALDIKSFVFSNDQSVSVETDWGGMLQSIGMSRKGNFLHSLDKSACGYFNTVLSPRADAFHESHFHVDLLPLKPGRFKFCH